MKLVAEYIATMPHDATAEDFCNGVTNVIRGVYADNGIDITRLSNHAEERLTASAVVYSAGLRQIWMVGDCQCLIDGKMFDNPKPYEETMATQRADIINDALKHGLLTVDDVINGHDIGREHIINKLITCCAEQNKTFAVIDGFNIPMRFVKIINVPQDAREIVLASDGYPFLLPTLEESETALQRQMADDPLCIASFKATKGLRKGYSSFDDRSYIRLTLNE